MARNPAQQINKLKGKIMDKLVINKENTLNASTVKRISWNGLTQFFQRMFSVHELAEHFSLGKTKSR